MNKKLYSVRLDYQALLADGRATALSQYGDVTATDAEGAILDALRVFREEREKRSHVVEVWGLKAHVCLTSDVERQDLEELLTNSPEPADKFTGHNDRNGQPVHGGDHLDDGHSVFAVRWSQKESTWFLDRVSGSYRYPTLYQIETMVKVTHGPT
jgi:hypothetical protein